MIKNILRRLIPPRKSKVSTHETKFGSVLATLTSDERSILLSFYSQWVTGDKEYLVALVSAPKKVRKAWDQIAKNTDRQEINEDFQKYFETTTDNAVNILEAIQVRIR